MDRRRWELCVRLQSTGVTGGRAHSSHVGQFSCLLQERALNVRVKHGAQLHAQHTDTHTRRHKHADIHTHNKAQLHHAGLFPNGVVSFMTPSAPFEKSK